MDKLFWILCINFLLANQLSATTPASPEKTKLQVVPGSLTCLARVTGKPLPGETYPSPNHTDSLYDVGGTDLGIVWDMGRGQAGIFFGDTYGKDFVSLPAGGPSGGNWRSNVLAFSADKNPEDGITFSGMATDRPDTAREIVYGAKDVSGTGDWTSIPTAAIHAAGKDYLHYMNIRKWGKPGEWETNYSGLYVSANRGKNWSPCPTVRFEAQSNFSQVAYARKDGYIYMAGTKPGRSGSVYLARVKEKHMETTSRYEYWNKEKGWIKGKEIAATAIVEDRVGELSLLYHRTYKKWIMTYLSGSRYEIVLRSADEINGTWSEPQTLVKGKDYPALYGAFMHPWFDKGDTIYFLMSMWKPYNVFFMKAKIKLEKQ